MTSVRRALALSMAERYVLVVLALASNMLIARLLTPEEIGLYSVSLAVVGLSHMVRDFGIGSYLIQHKDLQDRHVRTAFGMMLIIGVLLFTLLYFAGPLAGRFYGDTRVSETLRIGALNFLVLPFCSISMSLLRREMRFKALAIAALSGGLIGTVATVGLAWAGFGPNGLAIGALVTNAVTGIAAWAARRDSVVYKPSFSEWRAVLGYGGQSVLTNVVGAASTNINDLALAKVLGFAPAAMISRAQGLPNMFQRDLMRAVQGVAFPAFAKVHREGGAVEPRWTAAIGAITVLAWPFYGFAALMSLEAMRLMFGDQWDEAARLVPIFCGAGAILAVASLVEHMLLAMGRIDLVTRLELTVQPARALVITAVAVTTRSLEHCAWAYLLCAAAQTPLWYAVKMRCSRFDWPALVAQLRASLAVTMITLAIPMGAAWVFGFGREKPMPIWPFVGVTLATGAAWIGGLLVVKHPLVGDPAFAVVLKKLRLR